MANKFVELVKRTLKSNKLGQSIYPFLNRMYRLYSVPKRRQRLQKYGYEALDYLFEIAQKENVGLFLSFGTLLGSIREKGFIPHDDDIDLGVLPCPSIDATELAKVLVNKYRLKFCHAYSYRGEVTEICVEYRGIPIDFFFYSSDMQRMWCYGYMWHPDADYSDNRQNHVRMVYQAMVERVVPIVVNGHRYMAPENAEEFIESIYGANWKCPDPVYNSDNQRGNVNLEGFGYILTYDELVNQSFWK